MSISVTSRDSSSASGGHAGDTASSDSFKAAVATSTQASLSVQGNTIDTGRYVITGSTTYMRPTDGGSANDGMVKIFDKTNNSFVDIYGDPHLYTSDGDRANFQADGLTLDLADGTQVQFKPTAESNGVSHIDSIAVSKGGETVTQTGYFGNRSGVSTSAVQDGGPSSAQGFNDVNDTILKVGHDGSLGTLVNSMGMQLSSTKYEESLDGMGGGVAAFANLSGVTAAQAYGKALAENAGREGGPNAADEKQASSTVPSKVAAPDDKLADLIEQLIALLQPQAAPKFDDPAPNTDTGPQPTRTASGTTQPAPTTSGDLASLLQQLITLLQGQGASGATSPQDQALIRQLLPLLQAKLDSLGGAPSDGAETESGLLKQLITALQPTERSDETLATAMPRSPSEGISGEEIDAMLAHSNGTGPEVIYADYDEATDNRTAVTPEAKTAQNYNPALGIGGDEIMAMLAAANGTGPEVNYADYHMAAPTTQPSASSTTSDQTAV